MTTIDSGTQTYASIDDLSVTLSDGVLSVTMNRPDSLNSLTAAMLAGIADAMEQAATDPRVRVARLGGADDHAVHRGRSEPAAGDGGGGVDDDSEGAE